MVCSLILVPYPRISRAPAALRPPGLAPLQAQPAMASPASRIMHLLAPQCTSQPPFRSPLTPERPDLLRGDPQAARPRYPPLTTGYVIDRKSTRLNSSH